MIALALTYALGCFGVALLFNLVRLLQGRPSPTGSLRSIRWSST